MTLTRNTMIVAILAALANSNPTSSFANSLFHCVQNGLTKSGFDTNGVDGKFGAKTFGAALAYSEKNPEVKLPVLDKNTAGDLATIRDWCFHLDPPVRRWGTAFKVIENKSEGKWIMSSSSVGPIFIETHRYANWQRAQFSWQGQQVEGNAQISDSQEAPKLAAELVAIRNKVTQLGNKEFTEQQFFEMLSKSDSYYQTNQPKQRDIVYELDGVLRGIVFFDRDKDPTWYYIAGTQEVWGEGIKDKLDWPELDRLNIPTLNF